MSQEGVKKLIGRMISDDQFRNTFNADPKAAIAQSGYHLEQHEIAAVSKLKPQDLQVKLKPGPGAAAASYEIDVRSAKL
ncbi:MAG: NHLP-related RiPP peptide [Pseudomonadota bacterium]